MLPVELAAGAARREARAVRRFADLVGGGARATVLRQVASVLAAPAMAVAVCGESRACANAGPACGLSNGAALAGHREGRAQENEPELSAGSGTCRHDQSQTAPPLWRCQERALAMRCRIGCWGAPGERLARQRPSQRRGGSAGALGVPLLAILRSSSGGDGQQQHGPHSAQAGFLVGGQARWGDLQRSKPAVKSSCGTCVAFALFGVGIWS